LRKRSQDVCIGRKKSGPEGGGGAKRKRTVWYPERVRDQRTKSQPHPDDRSGGACTRSLTKKERAMLQPKHTFSGEEV